MPKWGNYVTQCLDTLIEHGTDVYGPKKTPLIMAVLDVHTLQSPERPKVLDSLLRLEGRIHRRGERGSNLWNDQTLLRTMYEMTERTGQKRYADAADAYIGYYLKHCRKPNGLLVWGSHIHWDCYRDRASGDGDGSGPHEILINHALWSQMYRVDPDAVRQQSELIWKHHVFDKKTGQHNRHDYGHPGFDFPFAAGSYVAALGFIHGKTPGDAVFHDRANLVADWHWNARNPKTNLTPFLVSKKKTSSSIGFYGRNNVTTVSGPFASQLLQAFEFTGDARFLCSDEAGFITGTNYPIDGGFLTINR